eukprot:COSAG01_NODE_6702_length_3546_cov_3.445899_3_plen_63_part_00
MDDLERDRLYEALNIAVMMSQELQEFVDEAIDSSGDVKALDSVQQLLAEWNSAFTRPLGELH